MPTRKTLEEMNLLTEIRFSLGNPLSLKYVMAPLAVSALCLLMVFPAALTGSGTLGYYVKVPGVFWVLGALLPFLTRYRYLLRISDAYISKRGVFRSRTLKWSDISKVTFVTDFKENTLEIRLKPLEGLPMVVPLFLLGDKTDDLVRKKVKAHSLVITRRSLFVFSQVAVDFFFWLLFLVYGVLFLALEN